MSKKLLTPMMLAVFSTTVVVPNVVSAYDHDKQVSVLETGEVLSYNVSTFTGGGTQTFDFKGQPWDSDSDND